jgi:hypothetical protein
MLTTSSNHADEGATDKSPSAYHGQALIHSNSSIVSVFQVGGADNATKTSDRDRLDIERVSPRM